MFLLRFIIRLVRSPAAHQRYVATHDGFDVAPEEMLSDVSTDFNRRVDNQRRLEVPVPGASLTGLFVLVLVGVVFLGGYNAYLLVAYGEEYGRVAEENAQQVYSIGPSRGTIVTVDGMVIASTSPSFDLIVNPAQLSEATLDELAHALAEADETLTTSTVHERMRRARERNFGELLLLKKLQEEEVAVFSGLLVSHPELSIVETGARSYPQGRLFSHLLGYTGTIAEEELAGREGYQRSDDIGKKGVEYYFEQSLRGVRGLFAKFVTVTGEVTSERVVRQPVMGSTLELSVDARLQRISREALQRGLESNNLTSGAVVALNPKTGEVLSLVSLPDFDPNHFVRGLSGSEAREYFESANNPLFNRALSGAYPTGSVIKPFIATAALEEHVIDPRKNMLTHGYISVPSVFDASVNYIFRDNKNHGWVDMRRAIAVSSNVYFWVIGGGYQGQAGLGIERIAEYLGRFGWGQKLGITFGSEHEGRIPTPEWKERVKGEQWYVGDTYNISIGQGDLLATPMQVAAATAAVANGGTLYRPYVVRKEVAADGSIIAHEPHAIREALAEDSSLKVAREGMRAAVTASTGASSVLRQVPVAVAGKTGTAQTGATENHGWFTGFAPYDDPSIVLTVVLEHGKSSGRAVQIAYEILNGYFGGTVRIPETIPEE
ncbi:MAG: penicillin-binding protein 2 [Candidatus Spechtbacterales bacterium]